MTASYGSLFLALSHLSTSRSLKSLHLEPGTCALRIACEQPMVSSATNEFINS